MRLKSLLLDKHLQKKVATRFVSLLNASVLALGLVLLPASVAANTAFIAVGTLPGGSTSSSYDINTAGKIVGRSDKTGGNNDAFLWFSNTFTDLGQPAHGDTSQANAINNSDQVVGFANTTIDNTDPTLSNHAILWTSQTATSAVDLHSQLPGSKSNSIATDINDNNQIVGFTSDDTATTSGKGMPFLGKPTPGVFVALPTLGSDTCRVNAINNDGIAVGTCSDKAVVWNNDASHTVTVIGNDGKFGGTAAAAIAINNLDQDGHYRIAGDITGPASGSPSIFIWDSVSGQVNINLTALSTTSSTRINGINDSGQVVGRYVPPADSTYCDQKHTFVLDPVNGFSDVGTPGVNSEGFAINNSSQVSGEASGFMTCPTNSSIAAPNATTTSSSPSNLKAGSWKIPAGPPTIAIGGAKVVEGNSGGVRSIQFPVTLSRPATSTVTVHYSITPTTATAGTDYSGYNPSTGGADPNYLTGTLTFTPSAQFGFSPTFKMVRAVVKADTVVENDEQFKVTLSSPTGGYALKTGGASALGTIYNDDTSTGIKASVGDVSVWKGDSGTNQVNVWVNLSKPATATTTVTVKVGGGTAVAGTDYQAIGPINVSFAAGEYQKYVPIKIFSPYNRPQKTLTLTLSNPSAGLTLNRSTGYVTILPR